MKAGDKVQIVTGDFSTSKACAYLGEFGKIDCPSDRHMKWFVILENEERILVPESMIKVIDLIEMILLIKIR